MNKAKNTVRAYVSVLAAQLHRISGGKITPNKITIFGLLGHIPIIFLITEEHFIAAGVFLLLFASLDMLDGELARIQKSSSAFGAFLDSTSDRVKEIIIYISLIFYFMSIEQNSGVAMSSIALGISLLISYLNAAGDIAKLNSNLSDSKVTNKTYRTGYAGYEIRTILVVIGLLSNQVLPTLIIIVILGIHTCYARFNKIYRTIYAKN
jgi:phosphatidylglycerophosphate synthase